jgi:hypothetical protein
MPTIFYYSQIMFWLQFPFLKILGYLSFDSLTFSKFEFYLFIKL